MPCLGTGNFIDFGTTGEFNDKSKVWNDGNEEDIKAISKEMFNGQSDVPFVFPIPKFVEHTY